MLTERISLIKYSVFTLLFTSIALYLTPSVSAQVVATCNSRENTYINVVDIFRNLDITRTTMNIATTLIQEIPSAAFFGGNIDQICGCAQAIHDVDPSLVSLDPSTADTYDAEFCQNLANSLKPGYISSAFVDNYALVDPKSTVGGSFAGLVGFVNSTTHTDLVPINLAYYANDTVAHVPFIGKALAQTYGDPGNQVALSMVLGTWKLFRNISYGLLAIVMLVLGFMIMNRRKIDQQTIVTVQFAIPRIIIAIILITFSYPIGATMTTIGRSLMVSIVPIIMTAAVTGGDTPSLQQAADLFSHLGPLPIFYFFLTGASLGLMTVGFIFLVPIILAVMALVGMLWIAVKIGFTYVKMIVAIITSPIIFVIGAIPGNDNMTIDWFKQMAVYMLSLPAMTGVLAMTFLIAMNIFVQVMTGVDNFFGVAIFGYTAGGMVTLVMLPAILMMGFYFANSAPSKVEAMIMGEKKGGRR